MKSEATIAGQLNEGVNFTNTSPFGVDRFRLSSGSLEERIADRIRHYWGERGYYIDVAIHEIPQPNRTGHPPATYRAARSNLKNGLPLGYNELTLGICMYVKPEQYRKGDR